MGVEEALFIANAAGIVPAALRGTPC